MNEIKAGSEDDRLHGSTSARLRSLCRDNKTNLHTGQLAPGRMCPVSASLSRPEHFPRTDERTNERTDGVIGAPEKAELLCIKNLLTVLLPPNRRYLHGRVERNCEAKKLCRAIKIFVLA